MWKFHDFSIIQNLREINFGNSRSAKFTILAHLVALNFDFYDILHFLEAQIYQITKFRAPRMAKTAVLELSESDFT